MKLNFMTSDYLLTWNLLFGASISPESHAFKQKLWATYKKQYHAIENDKREMLKDIKNFIPDDDTLYNLIFEIPLFTEIKKETERHRLELLRSWDEYKKCIEESLKEILRFPVKSEYNLLVLHPSMDSVITEPNAKSIGWGRTKDLMNSAATLTEILNIIIKNEIGSYQAAYPEIVQAIMELAIQNELYTRMKGSSNYLEGDRTLKFLKRQIYPYWLMYLGAETEDFTRYMMRDQLAFDIDGYTMEKQLTKVNFFGFIDFCIKNQKYIVRINNLEII